MKKAKLLFLCSAFLGLCLTACNQTAEPSVEPEPDNTVDVFVLSGQSNMEGSTYYDNGKQWLQKACDRLEIDSTPMLQGFENIYTSYYGYYPYGGGTPTPHASNKTDPMAGKFVNTKVGMGNRDDFMGPELGIAHILQDYATADRPIYFIKCAFSGSGFKSQDPNWVLKDDPRTDRKYNATKNLYENKLKVFTENNLELIKETGKEPVIKGFLWHQGESDTGAETAYATSMRMLIQRFRDDFADYAPDQDGENIAFIDGYIYDGPRSPYGNGATTLNNVKQAIAEENPEHNFIINTSYKQTYGYSIDEDNAPMKCAINPDAGDVEGGCDNYHYKTYDDVRMGMGYGSCIAENILG